MAKQPELSSPDPLTRAEAAFQVTKGVWEKETPEWARVGFSFFDPAWLLSGEAIGAANQFRIGRSAEELAARAGANATRAERLKRVLPGITKPRRMPPVPEWERIWATEPKEYVVRVNDDLEQQAGQVLAGTPSKRKWVDALPDLPHSTEQVYRIGGKWTPEREALHDAIIDAFLKDVPSVPPGKRPVAVLTMGAMGWGKTTVARKLFPSEPFARIDMDAFREYLPEYRRAIAGSAKNAAPMTQDEVSTIAQEALRQAMASHQNILYDAAGRSLQSMPKRLTTCTRQAMR